MGTAIADLSNLSPPSEDGAIGRALAELDNTLEAWSNAMSSAHRTMADYTIDASCDRIESEDDSHDAGPDTAGRTSPANDVSTANVAEIATEKRVEKTRTNKGRRKKKSKSDAVVVARPEAPSTPDKAADKSAKPTPDSTELIDRLTEAMGRSDHLARYDAAETTENAGGNEPVDATQTTDEDVETVLASVDAQVAEQLRARHTATGGEKTLRQVCDEYFAEIADAERLLSSLEPEMAQTIRVQYRLFNGRKSIHQLVRNYEPPKEHAKKKSWWRG
jgi:hypothetical protein